jgi:hypothetical protein
MTWARGHLGCCCASSPVQTGEMELEVSYAPRPEYGLIHPILEAVPGGLAAREGADRLLLSDDRWQWAIWAAA